MKKVLVCGAGGFIGGHLVKRLKREGGGEAEPTEGDEEIAAGEPDMSP